MMREVDRWRCEFINAVLDAFLDYESGVPKSEKSFKLAEKLLTRFVELEVSGDDSTSVLTIKVKHLNMV